MSTTMHWCEVTDSLRQLFRGLSCHSKDSVVRSPRRQVHVPRCRLAAVFPSYFATFFVVMVGQQTGHSGVTFGNGQFEQGAPELLPKGIPRNSSRVCSGFQQRFDGIDAPSFYGHAKWCCPAYTRNIVRPCFGELGKQGKFDCCGCRKDQQYLIQSLPHKTYCFVDAIRYRRVSRESGSGYSPSDGLRAPRPLECRWSKSILAQVGQQTHGTHFIHFIFNISHLAELGTQF